MLVLKVGIVYTKFMLIYVLSKLRMPFHLKMTGTISTDDARVMYPHFKKSHFSYNVKYSTEMSSICIFVYVKMFLTAVIKDEHTSNDSLQ